jgi:NAD(P)-dependent dehydrogenase (short-subunit alcohol dehydrogenase family)
MPFVLVVGCPLFLLRLSFSDIFTDVETAIFAETTKNMMTTSEMQKMYPFKGPGKPIDIARMAVVLASEDASWMTGACVAVDGGYTAR